MVKYGWAEYTHPGRSYWLEKSEYAHNFKRRRFMHVNWPSKSSYQCFWQQCPRNHESFNKRHKMRNHIRTHTGEKPFQCDYKGKRTTPKKNGHCWLFSGGGLYRLSETILKIGWSDYACENTLEHSIVFMPPLQQSLLPYKLIEKA